MENSEYTNRLISLIIPAVLAEYSRRRSEINSLVPHTLNCFTEKLSDELLEESRAGPDSCQDKSENTTHIQKLKMDLNDLLHDFRRQFISDIKDEIKVELRMEMFMELSEIKKNMKIDQEAAGPCVGKFTDFNIGTLPSFKFAEVRPSELSLTMNIDEARTDATIIGHEDNNAIGDNNLINHPLYILVNKNLSGVSRGGDECSDNDYISSFGDRTTVEGLAAVREAINKMYEAGGPVWPDDSAEFEENLIKLKLENI